jgi:predicted glycosyltransferase
VSDAAVAQAASNATLIPPDLRPLELMPLCSRLITKPGYSTFCEALAAGLGIHLVRREGFAEAPVLEQALQRHGWHRLLSRDQLEQGDWQLDQALQNPLDDPLPLDGAQQAAAVIIATACSRDAAIGKH